MNKTNENQIEKEIEIHAPVSRVWKALTDHEEFGTWFRVHIESPFVEGEVSRGHITYPGYEHVKWESKIEKIEPESYFAYTWHPYAVDPDVDYSQETPTLVEFFLESTQSGTLLRVRESGFEKLSPHRYPDAIRMNEGGWEEQMDNVARFVTHGG